MFQHACLSPYYKAALGILALILLNQAQADLWNDICNKISAWGYSVAGGGARQTFILFGSLIVLQG